MLTIPDIPSTVIFVQATFLLATSLRLHSMVPPFADRCSGMSLTQVARKHSISRASVCRMVKEVNESSPAAVVVPAGDAGQLFQQAGAGQ